MVREGGPPSRPNTATHTHTLPPATVSTHLHALLTHLLYTNHVTSTSSFGPPGQNNTAGYEWPLGNLCAWWGQFRKEIGIVLGKHPHKSIAVDKMGSLLFNLLYVRSLEPVYIFVMQSKIRRTGKHSAYILAKSGTAISALTWALRNKDILFP